MKRSLDAFRHDVPVILFVLAICFSMAWAFSGCCRAQVITHDDGSQDVFVDGRWWSKPVNGRAMFLMPGGWTPANAQ